MKNRLRAFTLVELLVVIAIIVVLAGIVGFSALLETPLRLVFGWIYFLNRNLREMTWSGSELATFGLLLVMITMLTYAIASYWAKGSELKISYTTPLFAVFMVVALFVAGIGATGVTHQMGWLFSSPEPWLRSDSVALSRMQDVNKLKVIGLATHNFNDALSKSLELPPLDAPVFANSTTRSDDGVLLHGWHTSLLPYLEKQSLYEQIDLSRAWNDPINRVPMGTRVPRFLRKEDGSSPVPQTSGSYAISQVAANRLVFGGATIKSFADMTDGLSTTVMAGNAAGQFLPWGHPLGWRGSEFLPNEDDRGFGSGFIGGCHVILADGAVRFITDSVDRKLWDDLFTPQGGETIANSF